MRRWIIACFAVAACGPSSGAPDATTSSSTDGTGGSTDSIESTSSSVDSTGGALDTSGPTSAASTGADLLDPCLAFEPPDCGPECTTITAYAPSEPACAPTGTGTTLCASLGEPIADTYRSTFFATTAEETWIAFANQPCVESLPGNPIAWTECSGAPGEPEVCTCGCAEGVCGWEAEANLLDGCRFPDPCPPLDPRFLSVEDLICVLTVLRDRTPAALTVAPDSAVYEDRVFVDGDDAQHRRVFGGICTGPFVAT